MKMGLRQLQTRTDYVWNGEPYELNVNLLEEHEVDIMHHIVLVHRGLKKIKGRVVGAGRDKHYNYLFYLVEDVNGKIMRSKKLTVIRPKVSSFSDLVG